MIKIGTDKATLKLNMTTTVDAEKLTDDGLALFTVALLPRNTSWRGTPHIYLFRML